MLDKIKNIIRNSQTSPLSPHAKISYSQTGEDVIVDHIFKLLKNYTPSYIDIGAHNPEYLNNTALFYSAGSRGINIEPDPSLFAAFEIKRKHDINLNIGISDHDDVLDFFIINEPTLNTFSKDEAAKYGAEGNYRVVETKKIPVSNVNSVIEKYHNNKFPDFLTLDAEGIDELVLNSIDYQRNFPTVICVETISFSMQGAGVKNTTIIDFLKGNGYSVYADTNINTIFVREDQWVRA